MIVDRRIVACLVASLAAHVGFARAMRSLPRRAESPVKRTISIRVVAPAPPAPEPPLEPTKPTLVARPAAPLERVRSHHAAEVAREVVSRDVPPAEHPPAPSDAPGGPVFGVSMESTSQAGGGPSMPIGHPSNPQEARGGGGHGTKAEQTEPVAAYEVTTMPLPQGRCAGKYTDAAKQAAIEGTVVLDLVVGADGRVREVHVVSGLGYGLTEAAVTAAKACRFSPGQKGDQPVPVRIREFKIRFLLQADE